MMIAITDLPEPEPIMRQAWAKFSGSWNTASKVLAAIKHW